ncbi:hypothetical protein R1flu_006336 [Riccia fluitans]|uniref:Uncharacterized protein n=1 Tax=Riccia fluitans TaxID=41844 RepID=A0ABD1YYR7_9MARC
MSNKIRVKLGYHRMAPPTTKLAMADNILVWPVGVLTSVSVVVEGIHLIFSLQVIEMDDPDCTQLILGRTWQKGAWAIIDMHEEVPWIILVVEVKLVPLTDKEKQNELKKYLKSIKRKTKLGAPPQIPTYPETINFWEDQFGVLGTPKQIVETLAEQVV